MRRREAETLPGLLGELAVRFADAPALLHDGDAVSFAELDARAAGVAGGLRDLGIGSGDRVALWLPNRPEWLELHLALARLGALTVAVNTRFRAHEVEDILERSQARALAFAPGFRDIDFEGILESAGAPETLIRVGEPGYEALRTADPAPSAAAPGAPCITFTSSGTTGRPKLVVHAQRGIVRHARAVAGGRPVDPETEVRAGEDGELEVRGPSVVAGYMGDEADPLTPDGFLRTGDLGSVTPEGFAFEGRRGDTLRLGGFLVSPREIEAFLEEGDDIAAAAVVAVEDDGAQRPVAFVVASEGATADTGAALERCRARLAAFKVPRRVIELDALPATESANGRKVRRAELRRLAADALQPTTTE